MHAFRGLRSTTIGAMLFMLPMAVTGQTTVARRVVVQVRVVGPDSIPLPGVNVAIARADVGAMLIGGTDATGTRAFTVKIEDGTYAVLARRPGFRPSETPLSFGTSDTVRVVLTLSPVDATELAQVRVEARPSNYILAADQIAASRRQIRDAFEALHKLRPYMLFDKDRCRTDVVENVWINGERVLFMAHNAIVLPPATLVDHRARRVAREPVAVDSVLASVRAEHLEEIRLVNCWDTSLPGVGAKNALYVALKPGVDWNWKRGSFIADSSVYSRKP